MTKPLNLGLIGAGRIGALHAETVATRIAQAQLVAICDIDEVAAHRCARRWGIKSVTTDDQAVVDHPEVDAVLICSATPTHARLITACAQAGKAIFCEKPIDLDLTTIDASLSAVEQAGVPLQVGFNRRFDPSFARIRKAVVDGEVGDPHLLRITSRDPAPPPLDYIRISGGMFYDMTIHDFDMARFLLGREVEAVHAVGRVRVDPAIGKAGDIDTAVITLEMEGGCIATIDNSRQAVYGYDQRVEVFGSLGVAQAHNETPTRTLIANASGVHEPLPLHFFMERYTASYQAELEAFVEAVVRGSPPPVTGADGRAPVRIAMAAMRSMEEGRTVRMDEV